MVATLFRLSGKPALRQRATTVHFSAGRCVQPGWPTLFYHSFGLKFNRQARFQIRLVVAQLGKGPDAGREEVAPAHKQV
jgi:hypothetical protein